jgi:hypothetical protein
MSWYSQIARERMETHEERQKLDGVIKNLQLLNNFVQRFATESFPDNKLLYGLAAILFLAIFLFPVLFMMSGSISSTGAGFDRMSIVITFIFGGLIILIGLVLFSNHRYKQFWQKFECSLKSYVEQLSKELLPLGFVFRVSDPSFVLLL